MINSILLIIFIVLIICLTSSALGLIIANNFKSHLIWSAIICFFLPVIGQIVIAIRPILDKKNFGNSDNNQTVNNEL